MPAPKYDWEAIKAMFIAGRTAREIAAVFGCSYQLIHNRSNAEGWGRLRKQLKATPPTVYRFPEPKMQNRTVAESTEVLSALESPESVSQRKAQPVANDAFSRALRLRSSDSFRERVISQADKALQTLEKANLNNVFETDRFAEALTKVERIGARAYGYDHEGEHPVINIGILGSGQEYEPS